MYQVAFKLNQLRWVKGKEYLKEGMMMHTYGLHGWLVGLLLILAIPALIKYRAWNCHGTYRPRPS